MNKVLTTAIASLTLENRSGQGFVTVLISPKCCCYGISALSRNQGGKRIIYVSQYIDKPKIFIILFFTHL